MDEIEANYDLEESRRQEYYSQVNSSLLTKMRIDALRIAALRKGESCYI